MQVKQLHGISNMIKARYNNMIHQKCTWMKSNMNKKQNTQGSHFPDPRCMRYDRSNTDRSKMMKCMNMKACTDHISSYTYKKIMKPSLN